MKKLTMISTISLILAVLCLAVTFKLWPVFMFPAVFFSVLGLITGIIGIIRKKHAGTIALLILNTVAFIISAGYLAFMIMLSGI